MMTAYLKLFYCEIAGVFSGFRLKAFRFHVQHSDLNTSWVSFHRAVFSSIFFSSKSDHLFQLGVFFSPLNSRRSWGYSFIPCFLSFLVSVIRRHFLESSPVSLGEHALHSPLFQLCLSIPTAFTVPFSTGEVARAARVEHRWKTDRNPTEMTE